MPVPKLDADIPATIDLSRNGRIVLQRRYLKKDAEGNPIESPEDMLHRVAANLAQAELAWGTADDAHAAEEQFYGMMARLEFLPNSPTLMNAGRRLQQLAACFVLPVEDDIEKIFDTIKHAAIIHKSGGGTGFSFSRIRPEGALVESSRGKASGPISFMKVFNYATGAINQGGFRRGANMGILRCDHPDVRTFARCKETEGELRNFNISVACTHAFMDALEAADDVELVDPNTRKPVDTVPAAEIWRTMVESAHAGGDPGAIFLDRVNEDNPTPALGRIECTNPCGEQPLLPYEACNLGSINLNKVVADGSIDWDKLRTIVHLAVRFLDNAIHASRYPLPQITEMVGGNRKIGLGLMGFADMLIRRGIPYNSEAALDAAEELMRFVREEADRASADLARERGPFPNHPDSIYADNGTAYRNACRTTIAPTGTISIIAGCSSGIEPIFALAMERNVLDGENLREVNALFEEIARRRGFWSEDLPKKVRRASTLREVDGVPEDVQRLFVTAHEIRPTWHVRVQAAFQRHVDNAVSKTVNLPYEASVDDVDAIYRQAYQAGCKGITIFRNLSRTEQVLVREVEAGEEVEPSPLACNRQGACPQ